VLAPNYQAGRDALAGFKRMFKGQIVGELYTRLDQTDFAAEMAQIRAAKPDVVFQFHPGGLGITFARQYQQAGLLETTPMVVAAPSLDINILRAVGDAAQGVHISSHWNSDLPNAANKEFVSAFQKRYGRLPTYYASQGYDTARAIGAALRATGGKVDDTNAFSAAIRKADFQSVRGNFKFGPNQHPIHDWYSLRVEKGADGNLAIVTKGKILENHGDIYAKDCKL
jgi:branched-chain amino acid transport system substrate-binding protein